MAEVGQMMSWGVLVGSFQQGPGSFLGFGGHRITRPLVFLYWGPSHFRAGIDI